MVVQAQEPGDKPQAASRPGWTDADSRTLVITVVGGLVVNIMTVFLVALAIIFVRTLKFLSKHHHATVSLGSSIVLVLVCITFAGFAATAVIRRMFPRKPITFYRSLLITVGICYLIEVVLILLGFALGVQ
jgi:hypothetical protein